MKKTVSVLMLYSMIVMSYTGIMLFIAPEGKVAYWVDWTMFGMSKTQFGDLHVTFMILFVIISIIHIYYNWSSLVSYFKNKSRNFIFFTKYNLTAIGVTFVFIVGTLTLSQPFKTVLDFQSDIKQYWGDELGRPPYGHAELSSLKKFSKKEGYDLQLVLEALEEEGIKVNSEKDNLKKIAKENGITPAKVYDVIFFELE